MNKPAHRHGKAAATHAPAKPSSGSSDRTAAASATDKEIARETTVVLRGTTDKVVAEEK